MEFLKKCQNTFCKKGDQLQILPRFLSKFISQGCFRKNIFQTLASIRVVQWTKKLFLTISMSSDDNHDLFWSLVFDISICLKAFLQIYIVKKVRIEFLVKIAKTEGQFRPLLRLESVSSIRCRLKMIQIFDFWEEQTKWISSHFSC